MLELAIQQDIFQAIQDMSRNRKKIFYRFSIIIKNAWQLFSKKTDNKKHKEYTYIVIDDNALKQFVFKTHALSGTFTIDTIDLAKHHELISGLPNLQAAYLGYCFGQEIQSISEPKSIKLDAFKKNIDDSIIQYKGEILHTKQIVLFNTAESTQFMEKPNEIMNNEGLLKKISPALCFYIGYLTSIMRLTKPKIFSTYRSNIFNINDNKIRANKS